MKKILPYITATMGSLALALNLSAAEPEKVRDVAKYVRNNANVVNIEYPETEDFKRWFFTKNGKLMQFPETGLMESMDVIYVRLERPYGKVDEEGSFGLSKKPYKNPPNAKFATMIDKGLDGKIDEVVIFEHSNEEVVAFGDLANEPFKTHSADTNQLPKYQKEFDKLINFLYEQIQKGTLK